MMGGDYAAVRINLCTEKLTFGALKNLWHQNFCI